MRRLRQFVDTRFFYDGTWPEGRRTYASQTVGGLERTCWPCCATTAIRRAIADPQDGRRFDHLDLADFPALRQARELLVKMRLPNGRPGAGPRQRRSTSRARDYAATEPYCCRPWACLLGGGNGEDRRSSI